MVVRSLFKNYGHGTGQQRSQVVQERIIVYMKEMESNSVYFQENKPQPVAQLNASEMLLENIIGMGEFGIILKVSGLRLDEVSSCDRDASTQPLVNLQQNGDELPECMHHTVRRCFKQSTLDDIEVPPLQESYSGGCKNEDIRQRKELRSQLAATLSNEYASTSIHYNCVVKRIRKDLYPDKREEAAKSLAKEQKFLQTIQHPNIIQLRGIVDKPGDDNHMLILDGLSHSLFQEVVEWKEQLPSSTFAFPWKLRKKQEIESLILAKRLLALYDIAQAVSFLHSKL